LPSTPRWWTGSMVLKRIPLRVAFLVACWALLTATVPLFAQEQKASWSSSELFSNLNVGIGSPYGGLGLNAELGAGHFSSFLGLGYAPRRRLDTITIDPTFNYLLGFRYYFNVNSNVLYPRLGVSLGWVTNYYNERIGGDSYKQRVEGMSIQAGTQIVSADGFILSLDLSMSSRYVILNEDEHPYFYDFYIRPTLGVGLDIGRLGLKRNKRKTIKNDRIDPLN